MQEGLYKDPFGDAGGARGEGVLSLQVLGARVHGATALPPHAVAQGALRVPGGRLFHGQGVGRLYVVGL